MTPSTQLSRLDPKHSGCKLNSETSFIRVVAILIAAGLLINMQERLNEEIRRREKVIRIFPNDESAIRLIGALLAEKHESWSTGKRYFDMDEFHEWREARQKKTCQKVRSII